MALHETEVDYRALYFQAKNALETISRLPRIAVRQAASTALYNLNQMDGTKRKDLGNVP